MHCRVPANGLRTVRIPLVSLFLQSKDKIVGKYLGMNYVRVREFNLYFVDWMRMLEYAIASGVKTLQVG